MTLPKFGSGVDFGGSKNGSKNDLAGSCGVGNVAEPGDQISVIGTWGAHVVMNIDIVSGVSGVGPKVGSDAHGSNDRGSAAVLNT